MKSILRALLGASLAGITGLMAAEPESLTAETVILHQISRFSDVTSVEYSEERGDHENAFSKTKLKDAGERYFFDYTNEDRRSGKNFNISVSYDGKRAFKYLPSVNYIFTQVAPFTKEGRYIEWLRGPFMAFEFLNNKDEKRVGLADLKAIKKYKSLLTRTSLQPERNRAWLDHPCVAVKVANGYNRWDDKNVDFTVYFAKDLDLFPVAWEMFDKDGKLILSFWVERFKTVRLPDTKVAFQYPESAIFRNNTTLAGSPFDPKVSPEKTFFPGADERLFFPDLQINHSVDDEDFSIDPSIAGHLLDLDTKTLITIPK